MNFLADMPKEGMKNLESGKQHLDHNSEDKSWVEEFRDKHRTQSSN